MRRAHPAHPHGPHAPAPSVCLLSRSSLLAEIISSSALRCGLGGVWQTSSRRRAETWLAAHRSCRLIILDCDDGLWWLSPVGEFDQQLTPWHVVDATLRNLFLDRR